MDSDGRGPRTRLAAWWDRLTHGPAPARTELRLDDESQAWPGISRDLSTVRHLALESTQTVSRVLLPHREGAAWSDLAARVGVALTAEVALDELDHDQNYSFGDVDAETCRRLVAAIRDVGLREDVDLIGWCVYADEDAWAALGARRIPESPAGVRWEDGVHARARGLTLDALVSFAGPHAPRFPVAVIPADGSYLIAAPGYSDSLYVSGPGALAASLRDHGLEALPLEHGLDGPLVSSHD
ncbi:hypothetical protein [Demequina soli]|uniref:hypothetical protein n=1 Tax=Demequina soli TaxID=1638987 RepID=UPI000783EEFE|nr:hypothetical protein [Demequina soli]